MTEAVEIDLDTLEGCKIARHCTVRIQAILKRYSFSKNKGDGNGMKVKDILAALENNITILLAKGGVGSISNAEYVALERDEDRQRRLFPEMMEVLSGKEFGIY